MAFRYLSSRKETLFRHEFGHGLHGLLSDVNYPVYLVLLLTRDYVEFPSQMMENWAREPEVIKTFAKHYITGETIPDELLAKISEARTFNEGFETSEYVAAAHLDMAFHMEKDSIEDIDAFEDETLKNLGLIPEIGEQNVVLTLGIFLREDIPRDITVIFGQKY